MPAVFRSLLALVLLLQLAAAAPAEARDRFEEGDWKSWPRLRTFVGAEVGRETVYFATTQGVVRWSRVDERFLSPWFSVPGPLQRAIFLQNVIQVQEDPLTLDVWVELDDGWVMRDHASEDWRRSDAPDGQTAERLFRQETVKTTPDMSLLSPHLYRVDVNNDALEYRNKEWPFAIGVSTEWGKQLYAWNGYGIGIVDDYNPTLELYPQGVGPCPGLAVTDSTIWAANHLSYDGNWLWKRNRGGEDRWFEFIPDIVWGLEVGDVQALQVGRDGTVWIATDTGVMYGNGDRFRHLRKTDGLPSERLHDVEPLPGGAWTASRFGLAWIEQRTGEVIRPDRKQYPEMFGGMWHQLTSDGDTLYAAAPGLLVKHVAGGGWDEIPMNTTVGAGTTPTALWAEDGWVAWGDDVGLAWRSPEGEWRQVHASRWNDGYVFSIDFHGGYFWLGTDRGLIKFDPEEGDAIVYTSEEGLPGTVVWEVIGEGDTLWLGTDVALVRFLWNAPGRLD